MKANESRLSRRYVWNVAILTILVSAVAAGFAIRNWFYSPIAFFDGADGKEIQYIQVDIPQHKSDVIRFIVKDQATITQILDAMKPISSDWSFCKWQKYIYLHVVFTDETVVGISVYKTDEEAAAFSIGEKDYRGGSEAKLLDILNSEKKRFVETESKKKS